ncbi:alpha-tocopherol transfer protein-like [Haematobia irritans]|uniref:alpha-tocopherol transfer protein-like n=1 Tax=Haematobia irritans TaxID=7368 RepID=UPI003F509FF6
MAKLRPLPDELKEIACKELGEDPSRIEDDLQALKTWIEQQPHLRARTDDQFLIQFLRGCKYSLEKAKAKIDLFFALKSKYPEMLCPTDVDEPRFRELYNLGCYTLLPIPLNGNGPRIMVYRFNYNADKYTNEEIYYPSSAIFELAMLNDPYAGVNGFVCIFDFSQGSAKHFLQISPNVLKKIVSFMEKSMPLRIRVGYFINAPPAAQAFFKLLRMLVSEKLRQRIIIVGSDPRELVEYIPLRYLPKDYGGDNGYLNEITQDFGKTLELHRQYFKDNANYGTNESLRPGNPVDLDGLFGVGGSFRKLVVD